MEKTIKLPCYNIVVTIVGKGGLISSDLVLHDDDECDIDLLGVTHAFDAIESIVLAHACAGIDIESPAYIEGIETAVDAILNNN